MSKGHRAISRALLLRGAVSVAGLALATGCGNSTPVPEEQAMRLSVPAGSQQVWCAGSGPAVVLVSGIGDEATSAQWLEVERALATEVRVCRYDRPGMGDSSAPATAGRGADELDAELEVVVEHAAGDDDVVLVAHSFGGYLARVYADRHPERISGLVFVDALNPAVGVPRGTGASSLDAVTMSEEQLDLSDIEAAASSVVTLVSDPPLVVLTRGEGATESWKEGQEGLAALSERSNTTVVRDVGHQIPSEAPEAVVTAVENLLQAAG